MPFVLALYPFARIPSSGPAIGVEDSRILPLLGETTAGLHDEFCYSASALDAPGVCGFAREAPPIFGSLPFRESDYSCRNNPHISGPLTLFEGSRE
jgi:hypothetical protein